MSEAGSFSPLSGAADALPLKLWIYTNYDCNLRCAYCLAESSPHTPRRAMDVLTVRQLVDEAAALGFEHLYFTGGEPLLLDEIYEILAFATQRLPTSLLTNAMLVKGRRLEALRAIRSEALILQVSLDGSAPEQHDAYRGPGSWAKTVKGIKTLLEHGFRVRLSTTETPANRAHLDEICAFHEALGIPEADHIIRPLAKRGFSAEGIPVRKQDLVPELTVNRDGVYWHPISTDSDMQVSEQIFPLSRALEQMQEELAAFNQAAPVEMKTLK
jgi:MoaA/NifB/PqqE/SkfB family radical SAM enzyme